MRVISYLGAGVYEEVLFRLCLVPVSYGLLRAFLIPRRPAILLSVLSTSILFSAAHYLGPAADQLTLFSFVFRALAGVYFALLFVTRGFGITVGSHAAYDLIVGITESPRSAFECGSFNRDSQGIPESRHTPTLSGMTVEELACR